MVYGAALEEKINENKIPCFFSFFGYFFTVLLSLVLDGLDLLIKLFSALSLLSINIATSELRKDSGAVI